jgi:hypothetical protein
MFPIKVTDIHASYILSNNYFSVQRAAFDKTDSLSFATFSNEM